MAERFLEVMLDVTDRCNLRCVMCYFSLRPADKPWQVGDMPLPLFRHIAAEVFPRARSVALSCGSEPLIVPAFPEMLATAGTYAVPNLWLVSNGMVMTEELMRQFIATPLHRLCVSLDAAMASTYAGIRRGANWDTVCGNLRRLRALKEQCGSPYPRVRLNFVMMRRNIGELAAFVDLAAELGADEIDARHVVLYRGLGMRRESLLQYRELANRVLRAAQRRALRHGIALQTPPLFSRRVARCERQQARHRPGGVVTCPFPATMMQIRVTGEVAPCTSWYIPELLGDFRQQGFAEVWNGESYLRLREAMLTGRGVPKHCRRCPIAVSRDLVVTLR